MPLRGIVIGGGIGGMALAAALERVGIFCEVHEQAEELREVGAGLTLWSNALLALGRLGAAERVMALGSTVDRLEVRSPMGQVLAAIPLARAAQRFGVPGSVCLHRADLLRELMRLSDPDHVHLCARCLGFEETNGQVIARFADGREARGDFLVGADGLRSAVRAQLFGDATPRYAGYTCWRGVATLEQTALAPDTAFEAWGRGRRFSIHHCGRGRLFWWAAQNCPSNGADGLRGRKADVQELFSNWHEPIPSVIAATQEILRNDIVDRPPIRVWGRGRITLLGDAAHPTTPNLGQGACQAIEDAIVLADQLRNSTSVESALRGYERIRRRRTARITNESLRFGRVCQWESPAACWLRNAATRFIPPLASLRFLERFFHQELPEI
jgi:2-polyprenyl-6-methoxyphenol hydroxylase-like FAD-dependent oxidoreductase